MPLFRPDEYYVSVLDIDLEALAASGIKGVLLDLDNTLMPRDIEYVPENLSQWVEDVKAAGMVPVLLSNSFKDRVVNAAEQLDVMLIGKAMKPLRRGYVESCEKLGMSKKELVMVGDQTYTDILGAHLFGMRAILVTPLSKVDLVHTKVLRLLDKLFLVGMRPKGGEPAYTNGGDGVKGAKPL